MARLVEVDEIPVQTKSGRGARLVLVEDQPSKPFGQQVNEFISDVPRQVGLTARAGLKGLGDLGDMIATPARAAMNLLPGVNIRPGMGQAAADLIGLPQPRDATERVVQDAAGMLASGGGPLAAGKMLARTGTSAVTRGVGQMLASNPGAQLASAAAAGGAGGYTRETGGNEVAQLVASLAAGLAAPAAMGGAQRAGAASARAWQRLTMPAAPPQVQIDLTINNALQDSGMNLSQLPADVARALRQDVASAMKISDNLSPDAVRRLADYRLTGLTPTRARLTQDVADITRQANLAKLGANSSDPAAQALARTQNQNNRTLTAGLNQLGANASDDAVAGGQRIINALQDRDAQAQGLIGKYYAAARATDGRSAMIDPADFTRNADDRLKHALLQGALPADVRQLLNDTATGKMPLTVDVAEQFKTRLAEAARDARAQGNKSTAKAADIVRGALEDAPLLAGQEIGQGAIDAFKAGRLMNRTYMQTVERTPALQAIREGVEPDKFVAKFIVGSGQKANVMDVAQLKSAIKSSPDALQAVREQILSHLKSKALSGAADETGNFSASGYRSALDAIGERKLRLFFSQDDVNQLKALGRTAAYEQFQPAGSAVNNSNTAGAVGNILERIGASSLLGKVPFGRAAIGEPLQNIILGNQAGRALNAPQSLTLPASPQQRGPVIFSPAAILGTETEEQRRRRELGLLP